MDNNNSNRFVEELAEQNKEFCIIGLTGKVRSGTGDVRNLLTNPQFAELVTQPANTCGFSMSEVREHKIMYRYLKSNWKPFVELNASSVIVSFVLDIYNNKILNEILKNEGINSVILAIGAALIEERAGTYVLKTKFHEDVKSRLLEVIQALDDKSADINFVFNSLDSMWDKLQKSIITDEDRDKEYIAFFEISQLWKNCLKNLGNTRNDINTFIFCFGILPVLSNFIREELDKNGKYTVTFQNFGNNIRATGKVFAQNEKDIDAKNMFALPERMNQFIKVLRYTILCDTKEEKVARKTRATFIVINNFKNFFEVYYFKKRYASFYLVAVSCDEKMRKDKFRGGKEFQLANLNENLSKGKKLYKMASNIWEKHEKLSVKKEEPNEETVKEKIISALPKTIEETEKGFIKGLFSGVMPIRKYAYKNNVAPFVLQDIMTCIENADFFVTRNYGEQDYICDYPLIRTLGRLVTLILHPGLLTPTKVERCMQIAMTAKLNSGCLSRQVGAVVTDDEFNILSLGWNDAPCCTESCIRRNLFDLVRKHDTEAYSDYELTNPEFRQYLDVINKKYSNMIGKNTSSVDPSGNVSAQGKEASLQGLPMAFCFKDIYQSIIGQRDQIYTRALHAEERALAACGNQRAKGGILFSTASPCELCAKKAKEANIKTIYYIEQYPGIAYNHIIQVGNISSRAEYKFFVGAVGLAYTKLYTPIVPYKDELAAYKLDAVSIYNSDEGNTREE